MVDLIVKSKIRETVKGLNVSSDVAPALNKKVEMILKEAATRAESNGRRTLQARDL